MSEKCFCIFSHLTTQFLSMPIRSSMFKRAQLWLPQLLDADGWFLLQIFSGCNRGFWAQPKWSRTQVDKQPGFQLGFIRRRTLLFQPVLNNLTIIVLGGFSSSSRDSNSRISTEDGKIRMSELNLQEHFGCRVS